MALRILKRNYGAETVFASARIDSEYVELAFFAGTMNQEWAETAKQLLEQGRIRILIPDERRIGHSQR